MTNQTFSIYFRVLGIESLEDKGIHWSWYSTFKYNYEPKVVFASINGYTDARNVRYRVCKKIEKYG